MQRSCGQFIAVAFVVGLTTVRGADPKMQDPNAFRDRIVLIGVSTVDDPMASLIQTMAPDGTVLRTVLRLPEGWITAGRVAPDGKRLAYTYLHPPDGKVQELMLLEADGQTQKIADRGGSVTAWSPDGRRVAFYRAGEAGNDDTRAWESFEVDVGTKQQTKLPLAADYIAEDWHPNEAVRTLIYMNPRNRIYREKHEDEYPVRQLDLLKADGKKAPVSKDPSFDNLWSRFSPTGVRIAHYRRRFVDGRPKEYAVICDPDGSRAKEVLAFTDTGDAEKLPWFRPHGFPTWSPDGKTIAWLVHTNAEASSRGEKLELIFIPVDAGEPRRVSLTEKGIARVQAIDWR